MVGSKSFTNRALIVAALARGDSLLSGALFSDDTRFMAESLRALGIEVEADGGVLRARSGQGGAATAPAAEAPPRATSAVRPRSKTPFPKTKP